MTYGDPRDQATDDAAVAAFTEAYGERATSLPPVAIVIAAYNEEGAVGPVIEALPGHVCGLATTAIVVADGCVDGTVKEAAAAGAMVCDVPVNRGQGAALRLGYRLAREGGAAYIVTTDADGQYNPAEIQTVLAPVVAGEADFVTGSRRLGSQETHDLIRRAGVRFFAGSLSVLTGQKISDTTFGLRAMRAEITAAVRLEQPQYQASELLIGVITHGYKVAEVPATIHRRRVGESKKGQNPFYQLHLPGVNNLFYGMRFARVVYGTWRRERRRGGRLIEPEPAGGAGRGTEPAAAGRSEAVRSEPVRSEAVRSEAVRSEAGQSEAGQSGSADSSASGAARIGPVDSAAQANGSGPGSVETSASSATPGASVSADPAKST
jgi:glycosyltransferase involved in cell wall biosynthesis